VIAVDSSVWITALRSPGSPEAITLRSLLDADEVALPVPVRTELLMGTRTRHRSALAHALAGLPLLYPTDETWREIDRWTERLTPAGHTFSIGDLLIGVLATEQGALVWSLDEDFTRLENLEFVRLYR
jgi:predicted nucleic acid-binding protein